MIDVRIKYSKTKVVNKQAYKFYVDFICKMWVWYLIHRVDGQKQSVIYLLPEQAWTKCLLSVNDEWTLMNLLLIFMEEGWAGLGVIIVEILENSPGY